MSGPTDFTADAFAARIAPHLVTDTSLLPARPAFGDATLNPALAGWFGQLRLRDAAVLVGVVTRETAAGRSEARVILTQRTEHLSSHAGQVAFPGGKIDEGDAGPIATALREAREEIGLDPGLVRPLGCFPPYASGSGFRIVPVVAFVRPEATFEPNPAEVAAIFEVPLAFLMTGANHRVGSRIFQGRPRHFYEMPYADRHIWGVTAGIVRQIFERTYGGDAPPAAGTPGFGAPSEEAS